MKKIYSFIALAIMLLGGAISANAQEDGETFDLTAADFKSWTAADGTGIATGAGGCTFKLNESTDMPYGNGSVVYTQFADLSKADKLTVIATDGTPRFLFNRTVDGGAVGYEYPAKTDYVTTEAGDGFTTYIVDIKALVLAQGFAHLHAIKGANWANVTVTSMTYHVPDEPIAPVYLPVTLYPTTTTPLTALTGTDTEWAKRIGYPKVFQSQGEVFGDGDGSNEAKHVNIEAYDKLNFSVSTPSDKGLALRVWIWDDVNGTVVTLYPHPDADFATADFTQPYEITEAGIYSVDIRGYKYLKGIKAANKYQGQTPIVVDYASVSTIGESFAAIDEARTYSANKILDFSEVTYVEAYIATACDGTTVSMKKVTGAVPANTGLVLKQASDKTVIEIPTCGEATEDVSENLLVATTTATNVPTGSYVLAGSGDDLGWYSIGANAANLAAGKAYLTVPSASSRLRFAWNESTGISNVNAAAKQSNVAFNIAGQRVDANTKGLVIINGKKFINK